MKHKVRSLSRIAIASVGLALLVVGVVLAATVTIDSFDVSDIYLSITSGSASDAFEDVTILGGEHEAEVTHVAGARVTLAIDDGDSNLLAYSQNASGGQGRATVRWDGNQDPDDPTTNNLGLGGEDLTGGGTNDSFRLRITSNDMPIGLTIKFFETASDYDSFTFNTPGDIPSGNPVDYVIPFASFTATGAGGDESSVEAVQLEIDGTVNAEADIGIELLEASSTRDFGDLPETGTPNYAGIVTGANGARHITQGLRLGAKVDTESDGQPNSDATGDDNADVSDEDGVSRDMNDLWQNNATVDLTVVVNGCGTGNTCYLNGWIDWNRNGSFADAGDQVFTDETVVDGSQTKQITVPGVASYTEGDDVYARFRLCASSGTCNTVTGEVTNGEVEDYFWQFGPNAVTLNELEARPVGHNWPLIPAAIGLATIGGVGLFALVQRRKGSASR